MRQALDQPWIDLTDTTALSRLAESLADVDSEPESPKVGPGSRRDQSAESQRPLPRR